MPIDAMLARLDSWLRRERPAFYAQLQPGLAADAWPPLEAALGVALPADFRAFYGWRNGQAPASRESFVYNFLLMDAEEIAGTVGDLNDLEAAGEFTESNWWCRGWVPFLSNGGGDHLCLDLAGSFGGPAGQVLRFYHDWECRDIEYPSFAAWLETLVAGLERGLYGYGPYGLQPLDDAVVNALQQEMNPGYPRDQEAGAG